MSFAFNPNASEFTPSSASPSTSHSGGQRPTLNAEARILVPNKYRVALSSNGNDNGIQVNKSRGGGRSAYERGAVENMTPFYQVQTGPFANQFPVFEHMYVPGPEGFLPNGAAAGGIYEEYDNVTYYKNGQYGKAKKKSKKRDMTKVYGYKGNNKRGRGGYKYGWQMGGRSEQSFYPDPEMYPHEDIRSPHHSRINSSNSSVAPAAPAVFPPPIHVNGGYGGSSIDEQMASVERVLAETNMGHSSRPSQSHDLAAALRVDDIHTYRTSNFTPSPSLRPLLPDRQPSPFHHQGASPAVQQQHGSNAADRDFAGMILEGVQNGSVYYGKHKSLQSNAVAMYNEVKDKFFPKHIEAFNWPRKTEWEMGYVNRADMLARLSEVELTEVYTGVVRSMEAEGRMDI